MTVKEFRENEDYSSQWAKELSTNGILMTVLNVLRDNHPSHFAMPTVKTVDISPTRASLELGRGIGYTEYEDTLLLMARKIPKLKDVGEPTYEKENAQVNEA